MEVNVDFWRIADFGSKVNSIFCDKHGVQDKVHHNTMDKWFKDLEEQRIHYVQRVADKKAYDALDLEIALFIMDSRQEKWNLDAIYNVISKRFDVRAFPDDYEYKAPILNEQQLVQLLKLNLQEFREEVMLDVKKEMQLSIQQQLPKPKSEEEMRVEKKEILLSWAKMQMNFKSEAIKLWEKQDDSVRLRKTGLFRKEEDLVKRDKFIDDYVAEQIKIMEESKKDL